MARSHLLIRALPALGELHRRMLGVAFALLGPAAAYALTGLLARGLYRLLTPLRARSEAQCRAALGGRVAARDVPRVAEDAFVHRIWNLVDLLLAERRLHPGTYARHGGRVPEPHLTRMLAAQRRGQAALLVSAYYGPFDLLPVFLGYNGVRAAVVYLPHANAAYDAHRRRVRQRSGCELVPVSQALDRLPRILESGGTVALVADHPAGQRGLPAMFLGLPTRVPRTVGLLAERYDADVVVAGIRRVGPFRFEIAVVDVLDHAEWAGRGDVIAFITERFLRGLERLILRDPTQYLWAYARWGEELASQLAAGAADSGPRPAAPP